MGGSNACNALRIKRLDLTAGAEAAMEFVSGAGVQEQPDGATDRSDAVRPGGDGGAARDGSVRIPCTWPHVGTAVPPCSAPGLRCTGGG